QVSPTQVVSQRAGRPASPATVKVKEAMQADAAAGGPRPRSEYVAMVMAGGVASQTAAGIIVAREAKRTFGHLLPRSKAPARRGGRRASKPTGVMRARLAEDARNGSVGSVVHYVRWLVDEAGIGLKQARPIVYRELRALKGQ
ncbi:MAG: hypothetical protein ACYDBQ_01190, partial [Thermoplasmatota archaeon]